MPDGGMSRRELLALAGWGTAAALLGLSFASCAESQVETETPPMDGPEALRRLRDGNARFTRGRVNDFHEDRDWRMQLLTAQHPFAIILGCSDSRVPPEMVFDQGFGDLFTIRVAGNVIAEDVVGSIEYAAAHLHSPLLVVLGHEGCGAVTAALEAKAGKKPEDESIQNLVELIEPGIRDVDSTLAPQDQLKRAVEANVRWSLRQLNESPHAPPALKENRVLLTGAVYELESGEVHWLA